MAGGYGADDPERQAVPMIISSLQASLAVGSALNALSGGAPAPTLVARMDQANAAVRDLADRRVADVLRGVLHEIDRCRRIRTITSKRLDVAVKAAVSVLEKHSVD